MIPIIDTILKIALTLVNTCGLIFALWVFTKWIERIELRQMKMQDSIEADFNRYSILYLELLSRIKQEFLDKGQIEDAMTFQKLINEEKERLRKK